MKRIITYYLKPFYLRMTMGFFLKFIGTMMDLFLPWTLAHMIDQVIPAGKKEEILMWGLFMLLCSILAVTFSVIANRMASGVASDAIYNIRGDLFRKVMYLTNRQADEITRPSLISRLTSDTYNVHQMLTRVQRLGVRAPILLIGGILMTLLLDPVLACVLLGVLPLLAAVVFFVSRKSIPLFLELQESTDRFVRLVREDIAGIRVIKALSKENFEKERFHKINKEVVDRERLAIVTTALTNPVMNFFLNIGLVLVILTGAYRVSQGLAEVGTILAFMTYFTIILNALMSISRMFVVVSRAVASGERISSVLDGEDEMNLSWVDSGEDTIDQGTYLEFDHVFFSYHDSGSTLEDIHFRLNGGETLGIIGATGSGKTAIVNLILGFYRPKKGIIRVNGRDIRTMETRDLRKMMGTVFQNDVIFEDTILENIKMGRNLSEKELESAAEFAGAQSFIREKGGMKEKLDIRGANLSGGQKQRIFISRALAARPEFLILDDSSSALDYKTDARIRKNIKDHYAHTACVIIAQRISSVMNADQIMVLEEGRMVDFGNHEQLMESSELYREIWKSQMEA